MTYPKGLKYNASQVYKQMTHIDISSECIWKDHETMETLITTEVWQVYVDYDFMYMLFLVTYIV